METDGPARTRLPGESPDVVVAAGATDEPSISRAVADSEVGACALTGETFATVWFHRMSQQQQRAFNAGCDDFD